MSRRVALALSGSRGCYSSALLADGALRASSGGTRRDDLVPQVAALFAAAGLRPQALTELCVDIGPGSYTGLRAALTFARTLAALRALPLRYATSFELFGAAALRDRVAGPGAALRAVLDARRGRLHHARLELGTCVTLCGPPRADTPAALAQSLQPDEVVLGEPGIESLLQGLLPASARFLPLPEPTAELLLAGTIGLREGVPQAVEPLYLMGSYAE